MGIVSKSLLQTRPQSLVTFSMVRFMKRYYPMEKLPIKQAASSNDKDVGILLEVTCWQCQRLRREGILSDQASFLNNSLAP